MRSKLTFMVMVAALATLISVPACAGHFDFGLFGSRHSVDVNVDVDVDVEYFPSAVLIKAQGNRAIVPLQGRGDMTAIGDFEVEETKRSYSEVALGYKLGFVTLFAGYSTRAVFSEERKVVKNELTGKNEIIARHDKESMSGLVIGLNLEHKVDRLGVAATVAKVAGGVYGEAKVKYYINEHLALLGGGVYHPGVNATGLVVGLGISY